MIKKKQKLAIIGLTDCEGCQIEFFSLKDQFPSLWQKFNIVSWRMMQGKSVLSDIDILLIEGSPITEKEREIIIKLRSKAKYVGTLGSCADLGGINGILNSKQRKRAFKRIYQKNKPLKREIKPLSEYIDIDFRIPGCPIRPKYLAQVLADLYNGKLPKVSKETVCLECKLNGNSCLLKKGLPCLGPITAGGCNSICINQGQPCFGCFGLVKGAQIAQYKKLLYDNLGKAEANRIFKIFLSNQINTKKN